MLTRRVLIGSLLAAPLVVRSGLLMPVRSLGIVVRQIQTYRWCVYVEAGSPLTSELQADRGAGWETVDGSFYFKWADIKEPMSIVPIVRLAS